ncbi:MAG: POT family MFS transporter [Desulfobacteraceae bacterium]|nr:POT family MFS transporter [Desulfobacteraceae bacterium]
MTTAIKRKRFPYRIPFTTQNEGAKGRRFPPQIPFIIGNEGAERYSYYGMRSILTVFMIQYLTMSKADATWTYHIFAGGCYLLPLLGAFISDRLLGKYKTIISLSLVYCLGHLVLALFESKLGLYWGLGLIALGSGGIKPCVSAFVGDQFKKGQEDGLRQIFNLFYWIINFGSFFATLITPWTLPKFGPSVAFGIPGILMGIATLIFWLGRKQYVHVPPTKKDAHGFLPVLVSGFKNRGNGITFWEGALKDHSQNDIDGARAVLGIGRVFAMIMLFWSLFEQHGSTWVIQARDMNLHFMGIDLLPSQMAALNPIMVMCLIPIFAKGIYPGLEKMGYNVTPLRKMGVGMFLAAFSFVLIGIIQYFLSDGIKLNVLWQFFPYLIITMAEILISITGLEFAYTQAPKSMKSTIMSMWLLTVFFGNMIAATMAKLNPFAEGSGHFFIFFALLTVIAGIIFAFTAKTYTMQNFMEE